MEEPKYFNILKYINSFEVNSSVMEHLYDVQVEFDKYLKRLMALGDEKFNYLMIELYNELLFSNQIEGSRIIPPSDILDNHIVKIGRYLTNQKICDIQALLLKFQDTKDKGVYRHTPVFIPSVDKFEQPTTYQAPTSSDVPRFMKDFITFFNRNTDGFIDNDPFVKSALLHFLLVKIHPFRDGNGRTTRVLHNLKFTNLVNRTYSDENHEVSLELCPLNISYSIFNNKYTYYSRLGAIDFYENADINEAVNNWIHFLLYMYEEQLHYAEYTGRIDKAEKTLKMIKKNTSR